MKTKFETKSEYETAIASALGHDALPPKYRDVISTLNIKVLDVILAMIEDAASSISGVIDLDGEDAAKLQHIEEAARKSHGKLADTILAIIESDSFAEDPDNLLEDDDAAD